MLSLSAHYIDKKGDIQDVDGDDCPVSFQLMTSYKQTRIELLANVMEVIQNEPYRRDGIVFRNFNSKYSLFIWFDTKLHIGTSLPSEDNMSLDMEATISITSDFNSFLEQCKNVATRSYEYSLSKFTLTIDRD